MSEPLIAETADWRLNPNSRGFDATATKDKSEKGTLMTRKSIEDDHPEGSGGSTADDQVLSKKETASPSTDDNRVVILGPKDAAIIFREEGTEEIRMPKYERHEVLDEAAVKCLRIATVIGDPEVAALIDERMKQMRRG